MARVLLLPPVKGFVIHIDPSYWYCTSTLVSWGDNLNLWTPIVRAPIYEYFTIINLHNCLTFLASHLLRRAPRSIAKCSAYASIQMCVFQFWELNLFPLYDSLWIDFGYDREYQYRSYIFLHLSEKKRFSPGDMRFPISHWITRLPFYDLCHRTYQAWQVPTRQHQTTTRHSAMCRRSVAEIQWPAISQELFPV